MKKRYRNTEFSTTKRCKDCGKLLKLNLLHKKPQAELDYKCFKKRRLGKNDNVKEV